MARSQTLKMITQHVQNQQALDFTGQCLGYHALETAVLNTVWKF